MGPATPERRTVLIVEDEPLLRELSVAVFEEVDLDVAECESAEAALAIMLTRGREIVMIFADVRLPGVMDGFDLALEAKMRWPHLTIVVTSGNPGDRLRALPPGAIFLPKPWQTTQLLALAQQAKASVEHRSRYGR